MDRARGRFSKGGPNSPYSESSQSPRSMQGSGNGGSGSNSPANQAGGNGGDRSKRSREPSASTSTHSEKRQRREPAFGEARKRRPPRYDLDRTKPEGVVKTGHGSAAAKDQQIIRLTTNYFNLTNKPNFLVYQYHVAIDPEIEMTGTKKGIFYGNTQNIRCGKIFDGATLYTTEKLPEDVTVINGNRRQRDGTAGDPLTITIKFVKEVTAFEELPFFQVLNTVMRQALQGLRLQLVGRNYFDAVARNAINSLRVEVWPGYITSIRQHDTNILMCCETTSKVMRNETLYQILRRCKDSHQDYREAFAKEALGLTVLTDYNNKTYRIDDINWDETPESTFETKNGPKSYVQYYHERYHLEVRDKRQPLLLSKSKEKNRRGGEAELVCLIPEFCRATGITDEMRNNFQTMRALSEFTRLDPTKRVDRLIQFSRRIRESEESSNALSKLGMSIDRDLVKLEGRKLRKPDVYFGDGAVRVDRDFANNLRNTLYQPGALERWYVISTERDGRAASTFVQSIKRSVQFHISEPQYVTTRRDQKDELIREIDNIARRDPQLIMIVVSNNQADRYQAIKKKCCIDRAIPTQVVCFKNVQKNNMSVATKVAVQMCCKIGGSPWGIKIPLTGMLIIGYDVSYDTKDKKISFGALVATMDQFQSKFFSVVSQHNEGEQLSRTFTLNVMLAIKEFQKINGSAPSKIIIYRDGVGDGQIRHVLDHEKAPLEAKMQETLGDSNRFAFIIVNKKTNTRFFSSNDRGGGVMNPQPGTVVDTVVTLPERYDFYLIPTSVRQGTVSPTYFNVISDTLGLPAAKLQQLTYFLCHGYYNWTDAIAVPAVCKYASKLAFLCSQHLHTAPNVWQDRRLYFL